MSRALQTGTPKVIAMRDQISLRRHRNACQTDQTSKRYPQPKLNQQRQLIPEVASEHVTGGSHKNTSAPAEQITESSKPVSATSGRAPNDPREVKRRQLGSEPTSD